MSRAAIETAIRETTDSFAAIGDRFGLTRERVRQIAAGLGIKGRDRERQIFDVVRAERKIAKGYLPRAFVSQINRHLKLIGCRYCARCRRAGIDSGTAHCRECKAAAARKWYWANPEKVAAAQRRYLAQKNAI